MSRINYALSICLLSLLLCGCTGKMPSTPDDNTQSGSVEDIKTIDNKADTIVADEAAFFMSAVDAIDNREYERAASYLTILYKETGKKRYLIELVKIYSSAGEYEAAKTLLLSAIAADDNDLDAKKMLAANYIGQKEYAKALEVAETIAVKSKQKEDYDTAGSVAYVVGDYKTAQKYFRLSYVQKQDHVTADRIATVLFLEKRAVRLRHFWIHISECLDVPSIFARGLQPHI